jgi:hypothetical protein
VRHVSLLDRTTQNLFVDTVGPNPGCLRISRFMAGRRLILVLQSHDRRSGDRAQSCATCPSLIGRPRTYSSILWARILDAFDTSRFGDPSCREKVLQGRDGRSCDRARSCATCSSWDGRPGSFRRDCGPDSCAKHGIIPSAANIHQPTICSIDRSSPSDTGSCVC